MFLLWTFAFADEKLPPPLPLSSDVNILRTSQSYSLTYRPTSADITLMHKISDLVMEKSCKELTPLIELIEERWIHSDRTSRKDFFIRYMLDEMNNRCALHPEIEPVTFIPELPMTGKPVIYLYPEETTKVDVSLETAWSIFFTYPEYNNGWSVTATPDGTLYDDGNEYSYLFRDGYDTHDYYDLEQGFVVHRDHYVDFLKESLKDLWLTPKEYNEFIVFWAPKMLAYNSQYILVHVASESEYDNRNPLSIMPAPDTIERVYLVFKPLESYQELEPQEFTWFDRDWFTVVERWGTDLGEWEESRKD